jgi:hypothetical protein
MSTRLAVVALVVLLVLAGCAGQSPLPSSTTEQSSSAASATSGVSSTDIAALRDAFAASGFDVTASGPTTGGVLPSPAQFFPFAVNASPVQVYRFSTSQEASAVASKVGADGTSLITQSGPALVEWKGRPHFFMRDRLIVLYLSSQDLSSSVESNDTMILGFLERQMGPQFAGQ